MGKPRYIGVDLGGTKILAAVVSKGGKIKETVKERTPAKEGPEAVIARIVTAVEEVIKQADLNRKDVVGLGIGAPGVVDTEQGMVRFAPNLAFFSEIPLGKKLEKRLNIPVVVGNDVDVATYGEYAVGAGVGCKSMAGIFPGTGIGGALILDGRLHQGARGSANEIGHTVLVADGPYCPCGRQGCAEAVASRTAIERDLRAAIQYGRETVLTDMLEEGERIRSGTLRDAAKAGDKLVIETLTRTGHYLGLLAGSLVNFIDPEVIVFGGGLIEACEEWLLPQIRGTARVQMINQLDADKVRIEAATLGDYAGVLGTAMLARATFG